MKLIKKGAEADIYRARWQNSGAILKIRRPKRYRNPSLDKKIQRQRTVKESQIISQVKSAGIRAPLIYFVDLGRSLIVMQEIPGRPVHDLPNSKITRLSRDIGRLVGTMHKNGIMHGDLTTSNFILFDGMLYVIDFGLAQNTVKPEDFAVDLRLIKEILNSAHAKIMEEAWRNFLQGYRTAVGREMHAKITRLVSDIESRGRYATVV